MLHGNNAFRVTTYNGQHRCVAVRPLAAGELVLIEGPLVSTRDDVSSGLPSAAVEWFLVHALLTRGYRGGWVWEREFACDVRPTISSSDEEVAAWLCGRHECCPEDVRRLYDMVRCNAFSLESTLLSVEYGAAFYEHACRFNHSCTPNCLSIRMGGNMVIVALVSIAAGAELTHSYLPLRLLVNPRSVRAKHLHFVCSCERCASEDHDLPDFAAMLFPSCHREGPHGARVATFKLASASGDQEAILHEGSNLLRESASGLRAWPLAALDITSSYLSAYCASLLRASVDGASPPSRPLRVQAVRAARLQAYATARIVEAYERLHSARFASCGPHPEQAATPAPVAALAAAPAAAPATAPAAAPATAPAAALATHARHGGTGAPSALLRVAHTLADTSLLAAELLAEIAEISEVAQRSPRVSVHRDAAMSQPTSAEDESAEGALDTSPELPWARLCARFGLGAKWVADDLPALAGATRLRELLSHGAHGPQTAPHDRTLALAAAAGLVRVHRQARETRRARHCGPSAWCFTDSRATSSALLCSCEALD